LLGLDFKGFYAREPAHISYGNSICLDVCLSHPSTDLSTGEIETLHFHHMIETLVFPDKISCW